MTLFQYISNNIDRIKQEIRIGLIPSSILKHWQVYSRYDYYRRLNNPVTIAALFAAGDCQIKERWVFEIIRKMECEI